MTQVTLGVAKELLDAAEQRASEIEVPMCIAVVDDGANLVAFRRMDDGLLGSVSIAQEKAYTAVALEDTTEDLAEAARPDAPLHGIQSDDGGRFVVYGGGIPITDDSGAVVGAVGASSGTVEEDMTVAQAGVDAFDA
ncbi:DNA polymerase III subunit delta' [Halobacteriales archaeon QS_3_64_16]|nr:MAG: DNA polymerase III subunit delta' [Halobacteriales archaeon QS_3_64_16]